MSPRPPIVLRQRRDFGQTIGDSFTFMRQNWKPIWKAVLLVCGPAVVLGVALFSGAIFQTFTRVTALSDPYATGNDTSMMWFVLLVYPVFIFAGVMVEALVHEYIAAYERNEHASLSTSKLFGRALGQFWPYLGILLMVGLVLGLVLTPVFLTAAAGHVGLIFLVFVACFCVFVWLAIAYMLAPMSRADLRTGVIASLGRSFTMIKGNWWATFGLIFVMYLIISMIQGILFMPFYLIGIVGIVSGLEPGAFSTPPVWAMVMIGLGYLMALLAGFLCMPLLRAATSMWYYSLVEQKESKGLQDRLQNLGTV